MPHDTPLISTIVVALVLAFLLGALANRLKLPPLVGYLVAGIFVGPHTPGFVADESLARELSEIGVILLMFGVGLHFSMKDLMSVRAIAVPGAIVQIAGATGLGLGLATILGWTLGGGLFFGLALSVASTVVLIKALQDRHMLQSERGRIAIGWLIVEDLAMVLALVLVPAVAGAASGNGHSADPVIKAIEAMFATELGLVGILSVTIVKVAVFVGVMLVVGRRLIPLALHYTAHTGSRELFRLAVLAIALGVAGGVGLSVRREPGAGRVLCRHDPIGKRIEPSRGRRDAAAARCVCRAVLRCGWNAVRPDDPAARSTADSRHVLIIVVGKSILAFGIVRLFRMPVGTAIIVAVSLAQVGEFSFILAELGVSLGILPEAGRDFILAGAIVSIILNPVAFWVADRMMSRDAPAPKPSEGPIVPPPPAPSPAGPRAILIGHGRVGSVIAARFKSLSQPLTIIEDAEEPAAAAHAAGIDVMVGNAVDPELLERAGIRTARTLYVAIPNAFEAGQVIEQARAANSSLVIAARAHSDEEADYLKGLGADHVIMGEREIALGMLDRLGDVERP